MPLLPLSASAESPTAFVESAHAAKKRKIGPGDQGSLVIHGYSEARSELSSSIPSHPLDVKPLGNLYDARGPNIKDRCGTLASLSDELLVQIFECLEAKDLLELGASCRALYAFCRADDLWKALFIESHPSQFEWKGSWRSTFLDLDPEKETHVSCQGLFSDVLYRPFFCAHTPLTHFSVNIPIRNQIDRLEDLDPKRFTEEWANKPFILTSPVKDWPVYKTWSTYTLVKKYAGVKFRAEAVDWTLSTYVDYMQCNNDESPLYLFDCQFAEKMNVNVGPDMDYWPPPCFGEDLFAVLGKQRPDSRWLIVGPERSGSTFHKDPNATSAWNAVLRGSKYWIMFPSSDKIPPPPGVFVSEDQSEVTSPLSIAEWLLGFHEEARRTPNCKEGVCYEGQVLYVPSGWFHLVLNLETSVAITQNFIPEAHLPAALAFLRHKPDQISGFSKDVENPSELFEDRLREAYPDLLAQVESKLSKVPAVGKRSNWEALTEKHKEEDGGFTFGFGSAEDYENDEAP